MIKREEEERERIDKKAKKENGKRRGERIKRPRKRVIKREEERERIRIQRNRMIKREEEEREDKKAEKDHYKKRRRIKI